MSAAAVRVLFGASPPWLNECALLTNLKINATANCTHPGPLAEIFTYVLSTANISYQLVALDWRPSAQDYLDLLDSGAADTVVELWAPLADRTSRYAFSAAAPLTRLYSFSALVARNASRSNRNLLARYTGFMKVYSAPVWLCIVAVLTVCAVHDQFYSCVLRNTHLQQHTQRLPSAFPSATASVLLVSLLYNLYKAGLLGKLLLGAAEPPWFSDSRQLLQLVVAGQTQLVRPKHYPMLDGIVQNELHHHGWRAGSTMQSTANGSTALQSVAHEPAVYIDFEWALASRAIGCGLRVQPIRFRSLLSRGLHLIMRPAFNGSAVLHRLNAALHRASLNGYLEAVVLRYERYIEFKRPELHCQPIGDGIRLKRLGLSDVAGMHLCLALAQTAAACVFVLELCSRLLRAHCRWHWHLGLGSVAIAILVYLVGIMFHSAVSDITH